MKRKTDDDLRAKLKSERTMKIRYYREATAARVAVIAIMRLNEKALKAGSINANDINAIVREVEAECATKHDEKGGTPGDDD